MRPGELAPDHAMMRELASWTAALAVFLLGVVGGVSLQARLERPAVVPVMGPGAVLPPDATGVLIWPELGPNGELELSWQGAADSVTVTELEAVEAGLRVYAVEAWRGGRLYFADTLSHRTPPPPSTAGSASARS